jgi:AAA+ superfamily predicted ATPase
MTGSAGKNGPVGNAQQILSLLRSHNARDERRFLSVATQLAEEAVKKGHVRVAQEMHDLIAEARSHFGALELSRDPVPLAKPRGELAGILSASFPRLKLNDLVLPARLASRLAKLVREQLERARLGDFGLSPRRKILLSGPPGTGKTMTAAAIAGELNYPLFTIQLDGLITKFMGETAAKLRLVFDAMTSTRGVYFFDEVDALATSRVVGNDVGEARRVLNSLLQFLDEDKSSSLILAATNHPELLDRAVFRRFDTQLKFELPERELIQPLFEMHLLAFELDGLDWPEILQAAEGMSPADIASAAQDAARDAVLEHGGVMSSELILGAIAERRHDH